MAGVVGCYLFLSDLPERWQCLTHCSCVAPHLRRSGSLVFELNGCHFSFSPGKMMPAAEWNIAASSQTAKWKIEKLGVLCMPCRQVTSLRLVGILEPDTEEMESFYLDGLMIMARLKYHIELHLYSAKTLLVSSWSHKFCCLFADGGLLKVIDGAHLDCVVKTHPSLKPAMHLLPENVLVSREDHIPGLIPSPTGEIYLHLVMLKFHFTRRK